jgi:peptidoglycan/xylan/chitin deacetylase (PgdA/CDA1 family)
LASQKEPTMATLLVGYDIEGTDVCCEDRTLTAWFIDAMETVHKRHESPCTMFLLGSTLELNSARIKELASDSLWDLQQHTYNHVRFKTLAEERQDHLSWRFPGGDPQRRRKDQ